MRESSGHAEHWDCLGHAAVLGPRGLCALVLAVAGLGLVGGAGAATESLWIDNISDRLGVERGGVIKYGVGAGGQHVVILQDGQGIGDQLYTLRMGNDGAANRWTELWQEATGFKLDEIGAYFLFSYSYQRARETIVGRMDYSCGWSAGYLIQDGYFSPDGRYIVTIDDIIREDPDDMGGFDWAYVGARIVSRELCFFSSDNTTRD